MSDVSEPREGAAGSRGFDLDAWIRPLCALVVAGVAAYASYVHQREFALQGGADTVSASLWPLSVDGLLLLATVGLLKPSGADTRRARGAVWSAFLLGIAVSLAANIAAAPALEWKPVLVAGWPPVALLLSVELLVHRPVDRLDDTVDQGDGHRCVKGERRQRGEDPLLVRARMLDVRHRELHHRPASAETLRRELRVGARRSRQLTALVRGSRSGSDDGLSPGDRGDLRGEAAALPGAVVAWRAHLAAATYDLLQRLGLGSESWPEPQLRAGRATPTVNCGVRSS
ncbi:DUF2637 domain-containing protein [Streptomyces sp. 2A115]|uniref:DUF2637 domain-containing protein n=1 Tax=Streptomyces sp. 2A115 TaxID=3457439 RepID=UPI003FD5BD0C